MILSQIVQNQSALAIDAVFYPNIFAEQVNLQVATELPGILKLHISDAFGNSVNKELTIENGINTIPIDLISGVRPGLLSYQIEINGQFFSGKLIKQSTK